MVFMVKGYGGDRMTKDEAWEEFLEKVGEITSEDDPEDIWSDGYNACLNRVCKCSAPVIYTYNRKLLHPYCANCGGKIEEES